MFSLPVAATESFQVSCLQIQDALKNRKQAHWGHSDAATPCSTALTNWIMLYLEHTKTVWDSCPYCVREISLSGALLWTSHSFERAVPPYQLHLIFYVLWDLPHGCPRPTSNYHHPENCSCPIHVVVWYKLFTSSKQWGDPIKISDSQYEWLGWLWHQDDYHSDSLLINTVQHIRNNIELLQS